MSVLEIILGIICVARLTEIMVYEKIMTRPRGFFGITHNQYGTLILGTENKLKDFIGGILSCYSCTSVWVSAFVVTVYFLSSEVFLVLSLWMVLSFFAKKLDSLDTLLQTKIEQMSK